MEERTQIALDAASGKWIITFGSRGVCMGLSKP